MAHTFNFRNNTEMFAKIAGVFEDQVITPNSALEDKTIQWEESNSSGTKQIQLFPSLEDPIQSSDIPVITNVVYLQAL